MPVSTQHESQNRILAIHRRADEADRRATWAEACGKPDTARNARLAAALRRAEAQEREDDRFIPVGGE